MLLLVMKYEAENYFVRRKAGSRPIVFGATERLWNLRTTASKDLSECETAQPTTFYSARAGDLDCTSSTAP